MTSVPHSGAKSVTPGGSVAGVHPDLTALRAVDACGGIYTPAEEASGFAAGHRAALASAMVAVGTADGMTAALLKALDDLQDVFAREGECSMERFERLAGMFYRDTGYLAPGKDQPMGGADQPDGDELRRIYDDWFSAKVTRAREAISKATAGETRNAEPIHRRDGDEG